MKLLSITEVQDKLLELMKVVDSFCKENSLDYYIIGGTLLGAVRHEGFIPWDDDIDIAMLRPVYEKFISLAKKFPQPYEVCNYRNCKNCDYVITRIYIPNTYVDNPATRTAKIDKRLYFDIFPLDIVPNSEIEQAAHRDIIAKYKKKIWFAVPYQFSKNAIKRCVRKSISLLLNPFRNKWLKQLDDEMKKYQSIDAKYYCSMASQYKYEKQKMRCEIYGEPKLYSFCGVMLKGPAMPSDYLTQLYGEDYMELPPADKRRGGLDVYDTKIQ